MKNFINSFNFVAILIVALVGVSCESDDAELPKVVAGFTHTISQDTGTVTFINTSENADTYEWDFGDGNTSTENNPVKVYENGTYTVSLKAKHTSGKEDTFTDEINISIPEVVMFPISFDNPNVNYDVTTFNGVEFKIVENPDSSGANANTSNVGEITNSGASFEGFFFELGEPLDLSSDQTVKILFWSNTPASVLLKLEKGSEADIEVSSSHNGEGWQELYFTFDSTGSYSQTTFFVNGPDTTPGTFYIDQIEQINSSEVPCLDTELVFPIDFDCEGIDFDTKVTGDVSFTTVENPDQSGINDEETQVGQITNAGGNFDNAFFNLDTPIDFSSDKSVTLKLYSTEALPVLLKFEDGTEADVENLQNHAGSGWEELTFDLASSGSYNSMILFVGFNQAVAGTFYVDDIIQVAGETDSGFIETCPGGQLINDFESADNTIFSNFGGGVGTIIDNPDTTVNSSSKLARYVKNSGEVFGGITIALDQNTTFEEGVFSIDVKSQSVRQLLFKLEGLNIEKILPTSGDGWETLTYDFSDVAGSTGEVTGITLIMDNGTQGDGSADWTIDFDNIRLCSNGGGDSGSTGSAIIDFENNLDGVTDSEFETSGALIANPVSGTINTSANVYEASFTNANQWWGGVGFVFGDNVLDDQATEYKVKLYSTVAPTNVLFQVEVDGTNAPAGQVKTITTANEWVEITFNLTGVPSGINRILVRPDVGDESGTKPNTGSLYIDDISCEDCTLNSGGGDNGGGDGDCPAPPAGEFISDGDFEGNTDCWLLFSNGGTTSISTSVSNGGGSNSAQITSAAGANPGIKQERLGIGTIQPNTSYVVKFDIKADAEDPLADGAILNAFTFSEPAEGSDSGAAQHVLVQADGSVSTNWQTRSYTFTTAGEVGGGLSFLVELVCGGAATCGGTINVDNVSITAE